MGENRRRWISGSSKTGCFVLAEASGSRSVIGFLLRHPTSSGDRRQRTRARARRGHQDVDRDLPSESLAASLLRPTERFALPALSRRRRRVAGLWPAFEEEHRQLVLAHHAAEFPESEERDQTG